AADVMVMTSWIEGSPNVVKEGLACNLPVVSVSVGDVGEMLEGVDGCHICERSEAEFAARVADVLRSGERSDGRKVIRERGLDLATVAQRILAVYRDVAPLERTGRD
ncbi:MAG: glycosyltransferase, partial [Myxococcales bacterium]|nr:glycosyltransferase [Myxococcales bacterium]